MAALRAVHTREERAELLDVLVLSLLVCYDVLVLLGGIDFLLLAPYVVALLDGWSDGVVAGRNPFDFSVVVWSVEQRTVAVLLTVEVALEAEHVVRRVLVHRRIRRRTYHDNSERRISHCNDCGSHKNRVHKAHLEAFAHGEDHHCERDDYDYAEQYAACYERHTHERNTEHEEHSRQFVMLACVSRVNAQSEHQK